MNGRSCCVPCQFRAARAAVHVGFVPRVLRALPASCRSCRSESLRIPQYGSESLTIIIIIIIITGIHQYLSDSLPAYTIIIIAIVNIIIIIIITIIIILVGVTCDMFC